MGKKAPNGKRPAKPTGPVEGRQDGIDLEAIERLMHLMTQNGVLELEVLNGPDRKVRLSRKPPEQHAMMMGGPMPHTPAPGSVHPTHHSPPPQPTSPQESGPPPGSIEFCSPMVGTFYRSPNPESPPYVVPGDKIGPDTVLCIVEAMKVMNEIKSEVAGEILDVLVENGEAVEYGQPLFLIKKS